jgi:hypothetical protein
MIAAAHHSPIPPWSTDEAWREANASLASMLDRGGAIPAAKALAGEIRRCIETLDAPMESLCRAACPTCEDACCLRATVWFDFRDLIYLHLSGETIPPAQIVHAAGKPCRYLRPNGCSLPRTGRPYVCTWYLCPAQKAILGLREGRQWQEMNASLERIKAQRYRLEKMVIEAVR